jgi:hypothetical protein
MTSPNVPNLGTIITNPKARAAIYTAYGIIAFVAAAVTVGVLAAQGSAPAWLSTTNAVLFFVGTGVGVLATSNTPTAPSAYDGRVENGGI